MMHVRYVDLRLAENLTRDETIDIVVLCAFIP